MKNHEAIKLIDELLAGFEQDLTEHNFECVLAYLYERYPFPAKFDIYRQANCGEIEDDPCYDNLS